MTYHPIMPEGANHQKGLFRLMTFGTALSFGILGAIIFSMKDFVGGNATFEFSYRTVLGFILGFFIGWFFWWLIRRWTQKAGDG